MCDASGNTSCVGTTLPDGANCGTGRVCLSSSCIAACVPNVTCAPTATPDACKTYSTSCSAALTSTSCVVSGNRPDGTACGSGLVCGAGTCAAACTAGLACTPTASPDPCKTYATTCSSDLAQAFCVAATSKPDGTSCGTSGQTCSAGNCAGAVAAPTLSPPGGATYAPGLSVVLAHPNPTAVIFYTTNGTPPSDAPETLTPSFVGNGTVVLQATALVQAFAKVGPGRSPVVSAVYTITPPPPPPPPTPRPVIDLAAGFTPGSVQMNGSAALVGTRLRMVPAATRYQFGAAFFPSTVNVQGFTTDFSFQFAAGSDADGITFTVQGEGPFALGSQGGGLGYGPDPFLFGQVLTITRSVAVKFDTFDNAGEGWNSTGIYVDGAVPSVPAVNVPNVIFNSGHVIDVHMVYDGAVLTMTMTDTAASPPERFTTSFPIDIPAHVGGPNGWVGFTGATGGLMGQHEILRWTFTNVN
ncbi:MAG: chitobiase/beta-hexosaminidase C-terminal domain-containing protein [Anaeromyxobacteraceae bacterium]